MLSNARHRLKISIITVSYNSERTIEDTIRSVLNQSYSNIEYILIDGASNDSTPEIINKYSSRISIFISEPDNGIYNAMNKGIALADGDIIGFLNSDDVYAHPDVVKNIVDSFLQNHVDSVYADLVYVDAGDTNKIIRYWKAKEYKENSFLNGWMPPHPTFYVKREVYMRLGGYNTRLKSAADYELMLRFLHKNRTSTHYLPEVLVKMRIGGMSNSNLRNRWRANREDRLAWELNGLKPKFLTLIRKPFSKILQFLIKN